MSQLLKIGMLVVAIGTRAPSVAWAEKQDTSAEAASDSTTPHERTFEETREFMRQHSEESKRTGKM